MRVHKPKLPKLTIRHAKAPVIHLYGGPFDGGKIYIRSAETFKFTSGRFTGFYQNGQWVGERK